MMLHGHPVMRRAASGLPTVNGSGSGGAARSIRLPLPFALAAGTTPLAAGLPGRRARTQSDSLRIWMPSWLPLPGVALVVLDAALAPVPAEDATRWRTVAAELDATWFAPASRALGTPLRSSR